MKAIICTGYGSPDVLKMSDVAKPVPKDDEVLIKIFATAVTASDIFIRSSKIPLRMLIPMRLMMGISKPRQPVPGLVFSGEIEGSGKNIKRFKTGAQVYGFTGFGLGCYAEYKCMKEIDSVRGCIAEKPSNISHEEATAACYGGLLALQSLDKGIIKPGRKVLIYGASGTTGTLAVQIAKQYGAEVTGVCSTGNIDLVKTLGADKVVDYTDNSAVIDDEYDFILDAVGKMKTSKLKIDIRNKLSAGGLYASIDDEALKLDSDRLDRIRKFIEETQIRPVIDRSYMLSEIVDAHRYVETGHKKGGVAITVIY